MVRRTASLHRPGAKIHIRLHRHSLVVGFLLQHRACEFERIQILLGLGQSKMERQIRFPGSDEHGARRRNAISLLPSGAGSRIYQRLFGDMQPIFGRDRRQITDWLAQGRFSLCVGCRDATRAKTQGLPVDELDSVDWKEGIELTSGGGSMSFIKGAPNPNAAKVFVNWFLSRKGQTALQKYADLYGEEPPNSRRVDIPKDILPPLNRLVP